MFIKIVYGILDCVFMVIVLIISINNSLLRALNPFHADD